MARNKRQEELFRRLRAQGLRKRAAKIMAGTADRRRKPATAVNHVLSDLHRLAATSNASPSSFMRRRRPNAISRCARMHSVFHRSCRGRRSPRHRPDSTLPTNRRLGEVLGLVAELWLRLGKPVGRGQAFYRAMRHVDRCHHDLGVLFREGNLGVLEWLDHDSRGVVEDTLGGGESRLLADLTAVYLGQGAGGK